MMVKRPSWLIIAGMLALIPVSLLLAAPGSRTSQVTVTLTPTPTIEPTITPSWTPTATPTGVAAQTYHTYLPLIRRDPQLLPDLIGWGEVSMFGLHGGCVPRLDGFYLVGISVRNVGEAPAGPFTVQVAGCTEWRVNGLDAGAWDWLRVPSGIICGCSCWATVDSNNEVVESDETNNIVLFPTPTAPATCSPTPPPPQTPTPTPSPQVVCTAPACRPDEVPYCPGDCPGGCGYQCATRTPTPAASTER